MTLACEDAYLKLVKVVTVTDISDEDRVGNSLLQIWKLRFGQKAKLLFRLWAQGFCRDFEVEFKARFEAGVWSVFAADVLQRLWSWILVEKILKLGLINILKFNFSWDVHVWLRFWSWYLFEILKMKFDQDLCRNLLWTQPSGPLCRWQCFYHRALVT